MFKLRPIPEDKAENQIHETYEEIKQTLSVDIVPLVFQYIANYENYFLFLWQQIKVNVGSHPFKTGYEEVTEFTQKATDAIYKPSSAISEFTVTLHGEEKRSIINTVFLLEHINAILLLITIGVREALKGVNIGQQHLSATTSSLSSGGSEFFSQTAGLSSSGDQRTELDATMTMLSPIFGSKAITVSRYPEFFSQVAKEMDTLTQTEAYLKARVFLEQKTMQTTAGFPSRLGCSYAELLAMVKGKPYFDELLYLLVDTFPSQFPRLLFTTAVMENVLGIDSSAEAIHAHP